MSFPRYPKYKDSGVEWLGEVPEHWDVRRLKQCVRLVTAKAEERSNPVALENIEGWTGRLISTESDYQGEGIAFEAKDILFGKLRPYLAKVHLAIESGEAVGDFHVLRPSDDLKGRFTQYQLLTKEFIGIVDGSTYGSKMPRAGWDFLGSMPMVIPTAQEQTAIAAFLDRETAKIDALIAEQRRLIELLQEKRQAVISHAVTKGLNPDAPMKDSGIEWLGQVPEHWKVLTFRNVVTRVIVGIAEATTHAYADEGVPIVRSTNIKEGEIELSSMLYIKPDFAAQLDSKALLSGDIITTRTGANVGASAVVPEELHKAQCFTLVISSPKPDSNPHYYCHFINSIPGQRYVELTAWGSSQPNISVAILQRMHTVAAPSWEQDEIVSYINSNAKRLFELVCDVERAITLLQERRSALISAAVTGQIDVRGLAASEAI